MAYLQGLNQVMSKLNKAVRKVEVQSQAGLTRAALKIRREAMIRVPIVTGNLRSSAYTISGGGVVSAGSGGSFKGKQASKANEQHQTGIGEGTTRAQSTTQPYAEVGFTALYAVFVHENPRAGKTAGTSPQGKPYKRASEVGEWKFLENAIRDNYDEILRLVAQGVNL